MFRKRVGLLHFIHRHSRTSTRNIVDFPSHGVIAAVLGRRQSPQKPGSTDSEEQSNPYMMFFCRLHSKAKYPLVYYDIRILPCNSDSSCRHLPFVVMLSQQTWVEMRRF